MLLFSICLECFGQSALIFYLWTLPTIHAILSLSTNPCRVASNYMIYVSPCNIKTSNLGTKDIRPFIGELFKLQAYIKFVWKGRKVVHWQWCFKVTDRWGCTVYAFGKGNVFMTLLRAEECPGEVIKPPLHWSEFKLLVPIIYSTMTSNLLNLQWHFNDSPSNEISMYKSMCLAMSRGSEYTHT